MLIAPVLAAVVAVAAPPRYVAHALTLPARTVLVGDPDGGTSVDDSIARSGPRTIALGANGSIAAIVADAGTTVRPRRIVVWRANGSRVAIGMPSDAVLHQAFRQFAEGAVPFPYASFARVVLGSDGTPFATVTNPFSGAYSGIGKAVFRWTGTTWKAVRPPDVPLDLDIVTAEAPPLRLGLTADSSSGDLTYDQVAADPNFARPLALSYDGSTVHRFGVGTLMGLAGTYACGFVGEEDGMIMPDNVNVENQIPYALLWHAGAAKRLGRGIAFSVNASGVAVGDARARIDGGPVPATLPMRWDARGAHELGHETGTAFSIAPDGTFVGAFGHGAGFVGRGDSVTSLDAIVPAAHVRGAYAINARGRILVLTGSNVRIAPRLGYLDPVRS